jgi:uncharacterized membrane protein HdeD (DUF308 family)
MILIIAGDWRSVALRGMAAFAFGVLALLWPSLTLHALVLLFGAYALVDGVSSLADGVVGAGDAQARRERWPLILQGLAGIAVGILTFLWPDITALALLYLIAAWALLIGGLEIAAAIRLRRVITDEWLLGLSGVVSVAFAVLLVVTPGAGALAITWLIGWFALLNAGLLLGLAWRLRKLEAPLHEAGRGRHRSGRHTVGHPVG